MVVDCSNPSGTLEDLIQDQIEDPESQTEDGLFCSRNFLEGWRWDDSGLLTHSQGNTACYTELEVLKVEL